MTRARTTRHQSQRTKSRRRARGPSKRTSTRKPAAKKSAARRSRRTTARLTGGVWGANYSPGYSYLTVTRPAQIKQAESDRLQEALGWGEFQAPPQIGPATPIETNTDEYTHVFVV